MIRFPRVCKDVDCLKLFTVSLSDRAKHWFEGIDRSTIRSWKELQKLFLNTYFPPCLAQKLMDEINHFIQMDEEIIYEVWEHYKDLLRKCSQHGLTESKQNTTLFSGLTEETQEKMNISAGGIFVHRSNAECKRIIEEMVVNSNRSWGRGQCTRGQVAAALNPKYDSLLAEVKLLRRQQEKDRHRLQQANVVQNQSM